MSDALLRDLIVVGLTLVGVAALPRRIKRLLILTSAKLSKRHALWTAAGIAALIIAVRLCCLPILPQPIPIIPDEHSNLLLARTLAAGRFSNSVHPMWRHFETLFVLQQPSYASVYPPVQGALLAFGLILFGHPWAGVLASIAGMCIAFAWMLRAYVTRLWALYGGLLAGAGYGVFSYWTNSYWGGAGAAIGGALVFGALPRMLSTGRRRDAAILGLGCLILANSRPYEGFLAAVPVAICVVWHLPRTQVLVLGSVMLAGAMLTGWYNWRVTGSPFRLPHQAYIQQYAATPAFIWQHPRLAPEHYDRVLRDAHLSFGVDFAQYSTFAGTARKSFKKLAGIATFYWGPLWALVLLAAPEFLRERRYRVVLISLALCLTGILLTAGFQAHYAAPCTSILVLLLIDALRRICRQLPRVGAVLVIAAPLAWMSSQALRVHAPHAPSSLQSRPRVQARIAAEPGDHAIFVRYGPSHPLGEEWVYNDPDIDSSRVVWARDLGPQMNRELNRYYPKRRFWLVEPDYPFPRVSRWMPD